MILSIPMTRWTSTRENNAIFDSQTQHWRCSICGFETRSSAALRKHARADHNKCLRCRIMFESPEEFHEHLLRANCSQKLCFICKSDFSSERGLAEHRHSCCRPADDDDGFKRLMASSVSKSDDVNSDTQHACDFCSKSFEAEEMLEAHLQLEHFHCFPCSREFSNRKSLLDHLKSSSRHHFCSICETDFLTSEAVRKHRYSGIHEDPGELRIRHPSSAIQWHEDTERLRTYRGTEQLEPRRNHRSSACHNRYEEKNGRETDEYDKITDRLSRLTRFLDNLEEYNPEYASIVRIQDRANGFRQQTCSSSSSGAEDDSAEVSEQHFCCSLCDEEFESPLDREFHEYDNHQWCSVCNKQYASRKALIEHILSTKGHNFCFECCKLFFIQEMLVDHRKTVWHASSINKPVIMSDRGVRKKVYVCDDCQIYNVYTSEQALQRHLETHHFNCLECDRDFKSRKALLGHYARSRRHHFCAECEMNLPSRMELDQHFILGQHRD